MRKQKADLFDFWFSYSGKDKDFVQQLHDVLTPDFQKAMVASIIDKQNIADDVVSARLKILRYEQREKQANRTQESEYRLLPGQDIGELVFDISNNLLRALVISEDYFKSPVCMQELCMSLCSSHTHMGIKPLFLILLDKPDNLFNGSSFEFALPVVAKNAGTSKFNTEKISLAEALKKTHDFLRSRSLKDVRGYDWQELHEDYFVDVLDKLSSKLYVPCKGNDTTAVATDILKYGMDTISTLCREPWLEFVDNAFEHLCGGEVTRRLFEQAERDSNIGSMKARFREIQDIKGAIRFLNPIKEALKLLPSITGKQKNKELVAKLCSLAILRSFQSTQARVLPHFGKTGTILPVHSGKNTNLNLHNHISASFAQAIAYGSPVFLEPEHLAQNIDGAEVAGVVTTELRRRNAKAHSEGSAFSLFLNLVAHYMPDYDESRIPPSMDHLRQDKDFIEEFRAYIEFHNNIDTPAIILMRADKDEREYGYYTDLSKLDAILNDGFEEVIPLRVVELRLSGDKNSEDSAIFSGADYTQTKLMLREIFKCFEN